MLLCKTIFNSYNLLIRQTNRKLSRLLQNNPAWLSDAMSNVQSGQSYFPRKNHFIQPPFSSFRIEGPKSQCKFIVASMCFVILRCHQGIFKCSIFFCKRVTSVKYGNKDHVSFTKQDSNGHLQYHFLILNVRDSLVGILFLSSSPQRGGRIKISIYSPQNE